MFVGGALHAERSWSYLDTKFHFVPHDSIDFTAMIYIVENPTVFKHVEQWLYLHDTVRLLGGFPFWRVLTHRWCNWNQTCAVPLSCSSMSSNMELYAARYLWKVQETILTLKNPELTGHARHKWKERNIGWEDLVFRLCAVAAQWHVGNLATDMSTKAQLRTRVAVLTSTDPGFRLRTCEGSRANTGAVSETVGAEDGLPELAGQARAFRDGARAPDYAMKCRNAAKPKLRLIIDVYSAVFDGYHHPMCTGSESGAQHTLKKLEHEL